MPTKQKPSGSGGFRMDFGACDQAAVRAFGLLRMKRPQPTGGVAVAGIHSTVISRCPLVQMPAGFSTVRQYIGRYISSSWGRVMMSEWESMTNDDLFALRNQMQEVLSAKLTARKVELEHRLRRLNQSSMKSRPTPP